MTKFGFIITRHVNSEQTNKYWNQSVKLLRTLYPLIQIIVIDDNSNQSYVSADHDYQNITYIQSEYPQRGELLPYIYYLKYKWFPSAVIIHDSLFFHKRIPFEKFSIPILPLWHHEYDKENLSNILRITSSLTRNKRLFEKMTRKTDYTTKLLVNKDVNFHLCFGGQCFIKLHFLEQLQTKYSITNLTEVIHNRPDRCSLERVLGALFCEEYPLLLYVKSLFGDILLQPNSFHYTFDDYMNDVKHKRLTKPVIKVWTGR